MASERPTFSVILATRNRAQHLREALERLAGQQTQGAFTYEVLVVDNGSTDHTQQVVAASAKRFPVPLRCLTEGRVGKPYALNTALREARGEFFAFTDDDILTTPTWLAALWRCFREEQADGVGGLIIPLWLAPPPSWLTAEAAHRLGGLGIVDRGKQRLRRRQGQPCYWCGGNMALRRSVIDRVGPFDTRLAFLQDVEYYKRCARYGLNVVYEPTARVSHKVGPERMTVRHFRWRRIRNGRYQAYCLPWTGAIPVTLMPMRWYLQTLRALGRWLLALVTRRPFVERFHCELLVLERASLWFYRLLMVLRGRRCA